MHTMPSAKPAANMPIAPSTSSGEYQDSKLVDEAEQLIKAGNRARAVELLTAVLARAPANYMYEEDTGDQIIIRCWDAYEFIRYSGRRPPNSKTVTWIGNAYGRASYMLGFMLVEQGRFVEALNVLNRALAWEPASVPLIHEKVLIRTKRFQEARSLFDDALSRPDLMIPSERARLMRGKGFVLIEFGELDEAEKVFQESIALDPSSQMAHRELREINTRRLREGEMSQGKS
jgi:tetratricopeptide (TPR) repeat protein